MRINIFIEGDNILAMFVPGQPEYELLPLGENKFGLKNMNGFTARFNKNEANEVIEMLSQQTNGTFKAIRKQ